MSRLLALARNHGTMAILFGLELLMLLVAAVLFWVTGGALFDGIESLGYSALAGMIILIVLILVMPIWAVVHEHRAKRRSNPRSSKSAS
jgi:cytosine/uracil/thiamine/allantoin permease